MSRDPFQLEVAAARLDGEAAGLGEVLNPPIARAGLDVWEGPAQRRLWEDLESWSLRLRGAAGDLRSTAGGLRAEAARIRAEIAAEQRRIAEAAAARGASTRAGARPGGWY